MSVPCLFINECLQVRGESWTLHGFQQGIVVEGPLGYGSNIIAMKPTKETRWQCQ